ncbi:MAG: PD-(D/E)XK nuclease family protein [Acholeplasmatales bacterium]|jgi:ATP-dependent helicase/DNAse subunit B|nr:PD-(D/E)XK nuclease family protein [Acholeplasmatales bacterium]
MNIKIEDLDNRIIIHPHYLKYYFLNIKDKHPYLNFKLIDENSIINSLHYTCDEDFLICVLIEQYNYQYSEAIRISKLIVSFAFAHTSINTPLIKLRDELLELKVLSIPKKDLFFETLKNKDVLVINHLPSSIELEVSLNYYGIKYKNINIDFENTHKPIYQFRNETQEINYVFSQISSLLSLGVSINDILLYYPNSSYYYQIQRFSKLYHIPYHHDTIDVLSNHITKYILNNIETLDYEILLQKSDPLVKNIVDGMVLEEIKDSVKPPYLDIKDNSKKINTIKSIIFGIKLNNFNCVNTISRIKTPSILDKKYIFVIGFNSSNYPTFVKNNDYITDNEKILYSLNSSTQININSLNTITNFIFSPSIFQISFASTVNNQEESISFLATKYKFNIIYNPTQVNFYSLEHLKYEYAKLIDFIKKYGEAMLSADELDFYYRLDKTLDKTPFFPYIPIYKGISKTILPNTPKNYSYTSINEYYECPFKYYLKRILGLDKTVIDYNIALGNVIHHTLENASSNQFDIKSSFLAAVEEESKNYEFTPKEKIFLVRIASELESYHAFINKHKSVMSYKNDHKELKVKTIVKDDITLEGKIDIIYETLNSDNEKLLSIIDYKTSGHYNNIKLILLGLCMQLPFYVYLISKSPKFSNHKIIGVYMSKILPSAYYKEKKNKKDLRKDEYKLDGYFTSNITNMNSFVGGTNNEFVRAYSVTLSGYLSQIAYKRSFNEEDIKKLSQIVETKILEADENISRCYFPIEPKKDGMNVDSCKYCSYSDICFKNNSTYYYITMKDYNDPFYKEDKEDED